jgi:hypothetical protein
MALATTTEHTNETEKVFEAFESGNSEKFRASNEAAKVADRLLSAIWDEYRHHRQEQGCQAPPVGGRAA